MEASSSVPVLRALLSVLLALLLGAGVVFVALRVGEQLQAYGEATGSTTPAETATNPSPPEPSGSSSSPAPPSEALFRSPFVSVAEKALPAVVKIDTERTVRHSAMGFGEKEREKLRRVFPDFDRDIEVPSSGSGFLIDSVGHIVTNHHVVKDADRITVTLSDGRTFPAEIVGTDPATDIAVVRIEAGEALPYVPWGDSEELRIGDWVAAIGNPFGTLEGTLTVGVVSAKGRHEIAIAGGSPIYQDFIQTDASINFGNSGGPLVNTRGEAVGINTAFNAPGNGISFAISSRMARRVVGEILEKGRVVRGFLGITLQPLDPSLAQAWGLEGTDGVVVVDVLDETPAMEAGLEPGDVIVGFDGRPVTDVRSFQLQVAETPVGKKVEIRLLREGQERTLTARLAERPAARIPPPLPEVPEEVEEPQPAQELWNLMGLRVETDPEGRLVVSDLLPAGPAAEAGVGKGDVVVEADGRDPAGDPEALLEAAREAAREGRPLVLRILSERGYAFVAIPLGSSSR
jgi:serine protease Do